MPMSLSLLITLLAVTTVPAPGPPRPVPASSPVLFAEFWPDEPVWTMLAPADGPDLVLATCAGGPVRIRGDVADADDAATRAEAVVLAAVTESPLADLAFARGVTVIARGDGRTYRLLIETLAPRAPGDDADHETTATTATPESATPEVRRHVIEIRPPAERWTRFTLPFESFRTIDGAIDRDFDLPAGALVSTARPDRAMRPEDAAATTRFGVVIDRTVPGPFRLEIASIALLDPSRSIEDDVERPDDG